MDPITALGIAGTVVQFIDFTSKLISKGNEYHKSANGALVEHRELKAVATNMANLSSGLDRSLESLKPRTKQTLSSEEQALKSVVEECNKIALEFVTALEKCRVLGTQNRWKSFRQAFKTIWNKEEINEMLQRLNVAREQLVIHLLVVMSVAAEEYTNYQVHSKRSAVDLKKIIDENTRIEGTILGAIQQSNVDISTEIAKLSKSLAKASQWDKKPVIVNWQSRHEADLAQISRNISKAADDRKMTTVRQTVLDSLYFTQIKERRTKIPDAHAQTFKWIYDEQMIDQPPWTDFISWLQSCGEHDGLYWVTGKAGSGKSTLMRYLYDDPRTKQHLKTWAGLLPLAFGSCFFWNPGTPMQKSLTGLLQSLLHELLSQLPDLIDRVVPWRWRQYTLGATLSNEWAETELLDALHTLIKEAEHTTRICFFIDGLDEFDGDSERRGVIIKLLKTISRCPNIKVCLSSRPWPIFQDAFENGPKLCLEHLTRDDIKSYVQEELAEHPRFKELSSYDNVRSSNLVLDIVEKANGVFLWVFLVVRSLLQGLKNEDGLSDLFKRLQLIPADLDAYFKQMMAQIDPFYLQQASQLFQTAVHANVELSLMALSFIHEDNPEAAAKRIRSSPREETKNRNRAMARRVNELCKGLLEVYVIDPSDFFASHNVDFLHRTVRDFLLTPDMQSMLITQASSGFDPNASLCTSCWRQMQCLDYSSTGFDLGFKSSYLLNLLDTCILYAGEIETKTGKSPSQLLGAVDETFDDKTGCSELKTGKSSNGLLEAVTSDKKETFREFVHHLRSEVVKATFTFNTEFFFEWIPSETSFLAFTISAGLKIYPKQKLEEQPSSVVSKAGRPLLDYALIRNGQGTAVPPNFEVVETLLLLGANPNQVYGKGTVWGRYLARLRELEMTGGDHAAGWFQTAELLLRNGADTNPQTSFQERAAAGKVYRYPVYTSALEVFEEIYDDEQLATLKRLLQLREKPKRSLATRFGGLFTKDKSARGG